MTWTDFNLGWAYRSRVSAFQELSSGDAGDWRSVTLPHDAVFHTERRADVPMGHSSAYFPGGAFEYRKTFATRDTDEGKHFFLEFGGVYRGAMVYVNGALAGQQASGYSRFVVRMDPYLVFGGDNEVRVECRTHLDSRWYAGAGIHRDVRLIVKESRHIAVDGVRVTTSDITPDGATVAVAVDVVNASLITTTLDLTSVIRDAQGIVAARDQSPVTILPGERATVRHRVYVPRPELWSIDSPALYSVSLELRDGESAVDEETVVFGIRSLQIDPAHGLRINGEEVKLRGACIHSDNGPLGAAAIRRAEERRVELLKAAGFNAIRSAHNPISPALLDACDRLGMLVMDETFDMWTVAKSDFDHAFDFPQWWSRDVEAMVVKDINHPSVAFYSIGNEIPETGSGHGGVWGRRLAEAVRSLDPTRFVTNGINPFVSMLDMILPLMKAHRDAAAEGGVNTMMADIGPMMGAIQASEDATRRTAESFAVLDVAGMNYADARYTLDRELFPNRVIVGTETWPSQIAGNWALVTSHPHVIGDFTWTGWDYLGEAGIGVIRYADGTDTSNGAFGGGFPGLTAGTGDLDITGHRNPISYYREVVFGLRSEPYIVAARPGRHGQDIVAATPWTWTDGLSSWTWDGFDGQPIAVEVYCAADEVELLVNGAAVGRSVVGQEKAFSASFDVTYAPGEVTAIAYTGGVETGRASLVTAADALELSVSADRVEIVADTGDLAFVELLLTDGQGVVHNGRDRSVTVTVHGSGTLEAVANGNPINAETFTAGAHRTFDGRALAVVRPTGPGEIVVTVEAEGCATASVAIQARQTTSSGHQ